MTAAVKSFYDIPGWFRWLDMTMFHTLLGAQSDSAPGVLVELGTYLGKSTVVIGDHVRDGDRFVAVDLFGDTDVLGESPADVANRRESTKSYGTLTRRTFERTTWPCTRACPRSSRARVLRSSTTSNRPPHGSSTWTPRTCTRT